MKYLLTLALIFTALPAHACGINGSATEIAYFLWNILILILITMGIVIALLVAVWELFKKKRELGLKILLKKALKISLIVPVIVTLGLGGLFINQSIETKRAIEKGWYPLC